MPPLSAEKFDQSIHGFLAGLLRSKTGALIVAVFSRIFGMFEIAERLFEPILMAIGYGRIPQIFAYLYIDLS